ncbi:DMT family transporter [Roseomonas sp. OT10]|uniref:DMT family transporter n=1 Tax=Roseomonas cutis TaxID=2897332 RepID=UPI001E310243|nr:DMT family transporter [Roseomonas sp. OT10]UFN47049.1 DMT family transporter [Roseomonas sp. OT10]
MRPSVRAALLMIAAAILFTLETAAVKAMAGVPIATVVLARALGQFVPLAPVVWRDGLAREGTGLLRTRELPLQLLRGTLSICSWGLYYNAFSALPLATATVLSFTAVLFTTALAGPVLGEAVGRARWGATLVGFLGVLVILRPGALPVEWAALGALVSALLGAAVTLATRALAQGERIDTIMLYVGLITLAGALPAAWPGLEWPGWRNAGLLAVVGLLGATGMRWTIHALRLADASLIAPLGYVRLVFAALAGALLFGERLDAWLALGAALILGSALYVVRTARRR